MNVWINNPFDNLPGEGGRLQRYALLARALTQAGHRVIWWTSDFHHWTKRPRSVPTDAQTILPGVEYRLIPTVGYSRNISVRRALSHYLYARSWSRLALEEPTTPDLILISMPPLSLAKIARRLAANYHCKMVIDIQDAWPEAFERVVPRWLLYPFKWLARRDVSAADGVSVVAKTYLQLACCRNLPNPIHLSHHGIELFPITLPKPQNSILKLLYVGNLGDGYRLDVIVEGLRLLKERGVIVELGVSGDGPQRGLIESAGQQLPIRYYGMLRQEAFRQVLLEADCGIIPLPQNSYVGIPGKLADYLAAGLAVVNGLQGECAELLGKHSAGTTYEIQNAESFAHAIEAYSRDSSLLQTHQQNARRTAEEAFDADKIYPDFVHWLERVARGRQAEA